MEDIEILNAGNEMTAAEGGAGVEIAEAAATEAPVESAAGEGAAAEPGGETGAAEEAEPVEVEYPEDEAEEEAAESTAAAEPEAEAAQGANPALGKLGTAALTKALKESPELAQALEAQPRLKSQLYQMARRSQELAQYQKLVPSLTRAREAVAAADQLQQLDQDYFGENPQQFWTRLYTAQMQTDPATGQTRSSGAYERNVQFLHQAFLERMEQQGARDANGEILNAVRTFRDALGWKPAQSSPAREGAEGRPAAEVAAGGGNEASLPLHIRQKLEQAEANARELDQLRLRRSEETQRQSQAFMDETAAEVAKELRGFVDGLLGGTKLSDYDKRNIARDFLEAATELAQQDKVQAAALEEILQRGGPTLQTRSRMVARAKSWARQNGRDILEPILSRAGAALKQRQAQRQALQTRQQAEPAGSGVAANPAQPSAKDLVKAAEARLKRRLSDREILELA